MEILTIIPARGGSKGVPRKNVKDLAGKPLIAWTIETARAVQGLDRILVSTDDPEIADVSRRYGAEVPFLRPESLSTDSASSLDVVIHAMNWVNDSEKVQPRLILLLQPTSPLRTPADIESVIECQKKTDADAIVGVCSLTYPVEWIMEVDKHGRLSGASKDVLPVRRQDTRHYYQINGAVYLIKSSVMLHERDLLPKGTLSYAMPHERSLDIDTEWDFYVAGLILNDRNLGSCYGM